MSGDAISEQLPFLARDELSSLGALETCTLGGQGRSHSPRPKSYLVCSLPLLLQEDSVRAVDVSVQSITVQARKEGLEDRGVLRKH